MLFLTIETDNIKYIDLLQELFNDNASKMYNIALSILKNSANAEDAVQDAFCSLCHNIERYEKLTTPELAALCVIITKNKCLDQIKKMKWNSPIDIEEIRFPLQQTAPPPDEYVVKKENIDNIHRIISLLPEIYREIIVLRFYYEFGIKEISNLLNVPVKTIDTRLYRAKKLVERLLNDEE